MTDMEEKELIKTLEYSTSLNMWQGSSSRH